MAAGDGNRLPIGAWAGYSYTDTENDFVTTAFTSKRHNVVMGLDTMPKENWIVGVSVALERTSVNTRFNGGEQDITGISVTPYVGYLLSDWLSIDAAFGISSVSTNQFRTSGGARITSDVDSTRVFGNINATGTWTFGSLLASSRAGLLYATQDDDGFRESNGNTFQDNRTSVGRFLLGGELAYSAGSYEPYVGATFEHDFTRTRVNFAPGVAQPKADDSDVLFAVGLRYYGGDDVSGSIEYTTLLGRRNLDEDSISANVRWQF
jgi:outer membrane autotransporter protein